MDNKIKLLNEEDINEQDKILKYFYLIDSDQIVAELKELFTLKQMDLHGNSMVDTVFHTTFEKIYEYSSLYNQFINPENPTYSAFFGEPGFTSGEPGSHPELDEKFKLTVENLKCFRIFLKLFFRNHCITQGFFYNLFQSDSSFLSLTAKYDPFFQLGYFDKSSYNKNDYKKDNSKEYVPNKNNTKKCDDISAQTYNSKFRFFKNSEKSTFLKRVLEDCHCHIKLDSSYKSGKKTLSTDIKVPIIYKHWIYFVFNESYVKNISRNISDERPNLLLNNYKKLFTEFKNKEQKFSQKCDQFIFHTLGENCFGFSTINYINILLNQIHNSAPEYDYLKRYDGKILENILKQLSHCPMSYTRHLFLSYAFEALRYNEDVKCNYLQHPWNTISFSPTKITYTEQTLSAKGLSLITEFFNTINNISLPVLSSLWVIVLNKLIEDKDLLMKYYKSYIESHYELLTADFTPLLKDEMSGMNECCSKKGIAKCITDISMQFSLEQLMKQPCCAEGALQEKNIFSLPLDKYLADILYGFMKPDDNSQLQALSNVYQQVSTGDAYELQRKNFQEDRARTIFEFFYECP